MQFTVAPMHPCRQSKSWQPPVNLCVTPRRVGRQQHRLSVAPLRPPSASHACRRGPKSELLHHSLWSPCPHPAQPALMVCLGQGPRTGVWMGLGLGGRSCVPASTSLYPACVSVSASVLLFQTVCRLHTICCCFLFIMSCKWLSSASVCS